MAWDPWRSTILDSSAHTELRSLKCWMRPRSTVAPEDMREHVQVSSDINRHIDRLHEYLEMGFDHIYVHNVNLDQLRFIEEFGEHVLPAVNRVKA